MKHKAIHANCDKDVAKFKGPDRKVALLWECVGTKNPQ